MQTLTITTPDDWHTHLRDGEALARTVPDTAHLFDRAIVMPNLNPPVLSIDVATDYRQRILQHIPEGASFTPLMTLYLHDKLSSDDIKAARESDFIYAVKLYPKGATTNAQFGVATIQDCYPTLAAMEQYQLPLLIHGEMPDHAVDIFDREPIFIEQILTQLLNDFPKLKIVLEHISTQRAVDFVRLGPDNLAATITAHHLRLNRNDLLAGGIKPHYYCLPVVKRESDRLALIEAATSGSPKFFLGTDSAPHSIHTKETSCGCAGIYTAYNALSLYLDVFESQQALDKFEAFASFNGADFYGLDRNNSKITLKKHPWTVPETLPFGEHTVVPLCAGQTLTWQLADDRKHATKTT